MATVEAGSFTVAAAELGLSQPALSQSIQRLETSLGHQLLHRNRGNPGLGLQVTEAGQVLFEEAVLILARVARVERRLARLGSGPAKTVVTVGMASATPTDFVNIALAVAGQAPGVDIAPVHLTWGEEYAALDDGRVDVAFVQYPVGSLARPYVRRTLLHRDRVLVLPANHPLARRTGPVTLADISGEPLLDPGFADVPEMYRDFWLAEPRPHTGPGPFVVPYIARTVEEMCAYVASGRGLAITSETIAQQYGRRDVTFVNVADLDPVAIGIARVRNERRKQVLDVYNAIVQLAGPSPDGVLTS